MDKSPTTSHPVKVNRRTRSTTAFSSISPINLSSKQTIASLNSKFITSVHVPHHKNARINSNSISAIATPAPTSAPASFPTTTKPTELSQLPVAIGTTNLSATDRPPVKSKYPRSTTGKSRTSSAHRLSKLKSTSAVLPSVSAVTETISKSPTESDGIASIPVAAPTATLSKTTRARKKSECSNISTEKSRESANHQLSEIRSASTVPQTTAPTSTPKPTSKPKSKAKSKSTSESTAMATTSTTSTKSELTTSNSAVEDEKSSVSETETTPTSTSSETKESPSKSKTRAPRSLKPRGAAHRRPSEISAPSALVAANASSHSMGGRGIGIQNRFVDPIPAALPHEKLKARRGRDGKRRIRAAEHFRKYMYLRRLLKPWSDNFRRKYGRTPSLVDVHGADIPGLLERFVEYLDAVEGLRIDS